MLYLSSSVGENVKYVSITRGVNCIAYRTILSKITCTGLGGLSEPLNITCKSDDDRAGVCCDVLESTSCATPTSIPPVSYCVYSVLCGVCVCVCVVCVVCVVCMLCVVCVCTTYTVS